MSSTSPVVWITGASSGIGEALALEYASRGARLILSARNRQGLEAVRARCPDASKVYVLPLDLEKHDTHATVVEQAYQLTGQIDVLILNGGISQRSKALETDLSVSKRLMDVNFLGNVQLTKLVLPKMLSAQKGQLVVISSLVGKFGTPDRSSYSASKHALHGYYDSLRAELAQTPIRISIICPGFIQTNVSINALGANGAPTGKMDESTGKGMKASDFAQKAADAISSGQLEAYIGGKETLGVYVKRLSPSIFAKMIAKAKVR